MFDLNENDRYFFFPEPVFMGRSINGLSKLVSPHSVLSLVSGDVFVFFSHDRKRVKLLRWDGDGFILYYSGSREALLTFPNIARKAAHMNLTGIRSISS